jgi:ubiquinone/menaquinone biosynthesis C-methylase UbiE
MIIMSTVDVPSPIDLRLMSDALEWERTAMRKRPWRMEFFSMFAEELRKKAPPVSRVLELGSGPGFLAYHLLNALPNVRMVLLDFSAAMHELAEQRLGPLISRVEFVQESFKEPRWSEHLAQFDAVVTHQAVHELRHKRYALELHKQVKAVLRPGASYLVCDHFFGTDGMSNDQLYMTVDEQKTAIDSAGFQSVQKVLLKGGLVLHHAS